MLLFYHALLSVCIHMCTHSVCVQLSAPPLNLPSAKVVGLNCLTNMYVISDLEVFTNSTKDINNQLQVSILNLVFTTQIKGAEISNI